MSVSGDKVCACDRENLTLESFASLISERTWFIKWCERAVWAKHRSQTQWLCVYFISLCLGFFAEEEQKCGLKNKKVFLFSHTCLVWTTIFLSLG